MDDYRVPTVQVEVELLCLDGRTLPGLIFMPALSANHAGQMGPDEWINGGGRFFPFRTRHSASILLNKDQLLALTAEEPAGLPGFCETPDGPEAEAPVRRVVLEAGGHHFEGSVVIDMPVNQQRVLDYVNRPEPFLLIYRDDGRKCLVRKDCITSMVEV